MIGSAGPLDLVAPAGTKMPGTQNDIENALRRRGRSVRIGERKLRRVGDARRCGVAQRPLSTKHICSERINIRHRISRHTSDRRSQGLFSKMFCSVQKQKACGVIFPGFLALRPSPGVIQGYLSQNLRLCFERGENRRLTRCENQCRREMSTESFRRIPPECIFPCTFLTSLGLIAAILTCTSTSPSAGIGLGSSSTFNSSSERQWGSLTLPPLALRTPFSLP
jgi:hypothetical protein